MSVLALPRRLNDAFDRWLTAPETHAAGRIGLFRIVFGLFYLWLISPFDFTEVGRAAQVTWRPILFDHLLKAPPSVIVLQGLEFLLVFALILLIVGYHVRPVTLVVLVVGVALEMFRFSFGKVDHDTLFTVFYIPLLMLMGRWGATYSLDAALKASRTGTSVAASDTSWRFIWPMRVVLLLLSILFLTASYWKATHGTWDTNPATLSNLLLSTGLGFVADGGSMSPVILPLMRLPLVTALMQAGMLAFESLFFLSLFDRRVRNWFLALAIIFHAANVFLIRVSFMGQVSAYLLFVDWQAVYTRWIAPYARYVRLDRFPAKLRVGTALIVAAVLSWLWVQVPLVRSLPTLGGLLREDVVWLVLFVVAVILWVRSSLIVIRSLWARFRRKQIPAASAPSP